MDYDVIIVGGRVTGAILGTRLGQLGHRVLVLEKANFPSDTLSTAFFRAPTLKMLDMVGALDKVNAITPKMDTLWNYIDGYVLNDPIEAAEEQYRYFLCSRRITLDWILYKRLKREVTVDVRLSAKVRDLLWQDGRVSGVRWNDQDGEHTATAKVVVGADGFYSMVAALLNPAYEHFVPVQRFTYYTYFHGLESISPTTAEHHFVGNSLTYVFPTDGDLTMVAVSLPIAEFASFKKSLMLNFMNHLESLPLLEARLSKAELSSELFGSGNIPSYQRRPYGPGWVLVGDAHQVLDPWSGMGMDHGSTHAGFLADELNNYLSGSASWDAAMNEYHVKARAWSAKSYQRTSTHAADFRPMTHAALLRRGLLQPVSKMYASSDVG